MASESNGIHNAIYAPLIPYCMQRSLTLLHIFVSSSQLSIKTKKASGYKKNNAEQIKVCKHHSFDQFIRNGIEMIAIFPPDLSGYRKRLLGPLRLRNKRWHRISAFALGPSFLLFWPSRYFWQKIHYIKCNLGLLAAENPHLTLQKAKQRSSTSLSVFPSKQTSTNLYVSFLTKRLS